PAIADANGFLQPGLPRGEIVLRQKPAMAAPAGVEDFRLLHVIDDALRDVALVPIIDARLYRRLPAAFAFARLQFNDALERVGKLAIGKHPADRRYAIVGQIHFRRARPLLAELAGQPAQRIVQHVVHRIAVFGEIDGRLEHVAQRERAELLQCERPGAERRGHGGGQKAVAGDGIDFFAAKPLDGARLAADALAADREDLFAPGGPDENGHLAADAAIVRFQKIEREA